MNFGKMYNSGDVILANISFVDSLKSKKRPAVILFQDYNNIIVAAITSNLSMDGVSLSIEDGMLKESVVKINYIFTITQEQIDKKLLELSLNKKKEIYKNLELKLKGLKS